MYQASFAAKTRADGPLLGTVYRDIKVGPALVETINTRLKLVARLKRYKQERGLEFVDLEREEWMLNYLMRANRGPLSADGLRELFTEILDLTKREVARAEEPKAS